MSYPPSFAQNLLSNENVAFIAGLSLGFFVCSYIPSPALFKSESSELHKKRKSESAFDEPPETIQNNDTSSARDLNMSLVEDCMNDKCGETCESCHFIKCFDLDPSRGSMDTGLMVVEMPSFRVLHINYELQKFLQLPFDVNMWQYVPDACCLRQALLMQHHDRQESLNCVENARETMIMSYHGTSLRVKVIAKKLEIGKEIGSDKQVYSLLFNGL
mmetsp:Transcript_7278/g.25050  ORF Transcript_7278/g.25050 Transcript_7278/m.25050 type:complete len:216 (-) Transcript_7278:186-833(-)